MFEHNGYKEKQHSFANRKLKRHRQRAGSPGSCETFWVVWTMSIGDDLIVCAADMQPVRGVKIRQRNGPHAMATLLRNTELLHYKYLAGRELRALEEVLATQAANRARQSKPSCTRANTR